MPKTAQETAQEKYDFLLRQLIVAQGAGASNEFSIRKQIEELLEDARDFGLEIKTNTPRASPSDEITHENRPGEKAKVDEVRLSNPNNSISENPINTGFELPWAAISGIIALGVFLLSWWVIGQPKIAAVLGVVAGVFILLRNPDYLFSQIAFLSMSLLVTLNVLNYSGFFEKKDDNGLHFRVDVSEPSVWVSLGLVLMIIAAMYFHANRKN